MAQKGSSIRVINLKKIFKKNYALKNISFEIKEKGLYLFIGDNGAGKTTLFKILSFILFPSEGEIFYDGEKVNNKTEKFLKYIGFISHNPLLYPDLTSYENLEFSSKFYNVKKERIFELSEIFETKDYLNKKVKELSRGQIQRISLIKSLLHDPVFLYLDEPFNSLDRKGVKILENYILENIDKKIIFISSHSNSEIFKKSKKIFYLQKGELVKVE
ncbi:MAG: ABC transporter ATP-binding protein [Candidatus Hydrothermales bacterium]